MGYFRLFRVVVVFCLSIATAATVYVYCEKGWQSRVDFLHSWKMYRVEWGTNRSVCNWLKGEDSAKLESHYFKFFCKYGFVLHHLFKLCFHVVSLLPSAEMPPTEWCDLDKNIFSFQSKEREIIKCIYCCDTDGRGGKEPIAFRLALPEIEQFIIK